MGLKSGVIPDVAMRSAADRFYRREDLYLDL